MSVYSRLNDVPVSSYMPTQIHLRLSPGGHGFSAPSPFVFTVYAFSLIESVPVRMKGPNNPSDTFYRRRALRFLAHVVGALNPEVQTSGVLGTHSYHGPFEPTPFYQDLNEYKKNYFRLFMASHPDCNRKTTHGTATPDLATIIPFLSGNVQGTIISGPLEPCPFYALPHRSPDEFPARCVRACFVDIWTHLSTLTPSAPSFAHIVASPRTLAGTMPRYFVIALKLSTAITLPTIYFLATLSVPLAFALCIIRHYSGSPWPWGRSV